MQPGRDAVEYGGAVTEASGIGDRGDGHGQLTTVGADEAVLADQVEAIASGPPTPFDSGSIEGAQPPALRGHNFTHEVEDRGVACVAGGGGEESRLVRQ